MPRHRVDKIRKNPDRWLADWRRLPLLGRLRRIPRSRPGIATSALGRESLISALAACGLDSRSVKFLERVDRRYRPKALWRATRDRGTRSCAIRARTSNEDGK